MLWDQPSEEFLLDLIQRPARFSFLENSREFFFIFTSRSRSRAVSISLSLLEKEWRDFIFHFSLLEKSESYPYFTLFSREKEWNQVRAITSPLSLFPIVFPKIVKSQVSTSLKILAKFQFQNLDQTLCSKSEPNISLKKVTKTRLKFNCAHLRWTKESLTIWVKIFWLKIFFGENFFEWKFFGWNFFGWKFLGWKFLGWKFLGWKFLG